MFIPLSDDNSNRHSFPLVTFSIIALNCIFWLLQLSEGEKFTYAYSAIPFEILNNVDLSGVQTITVGTNQHKINLYPGPSPIYLTLLTAMFMHGSWMHIIGNMLYLFIFGDQIEDRLGKLKFILFYLLSGIMASISHILGDPTSVIPSLGASGAIAGVLGAYLLAYPKNLIKVLIIRQITYIPAFIVLGIWFTTQIFSQIGAGPESDGVAYLAHIGGFIAGTILFYFMQGSEKQTKKIKKKKLSVNRK
ncbi:MAG TPA: rhomboid family intramembrane serine protease [Oligoflexia bacterium]|nr:rhomboid family intramembrane serine protease [Oligoflexia bacterium]HMP48025.1 rhomboid family intramembrane serine protease [Oligoflexia bacterium]